MALVQMIPALRHDALNDQEKRRRTLQRFCPPIIFVGGLVAAAEAGAKEESKGGWSVSVG